MATEERDYTLGKFHIRIRTSPEDRFFHACYGRYYIRLGDNNTRNSGKDHQPNVWQPDKKPYGAYKYYEDGTSD